MKINLETTIKDLQGEEFKRESNGGDKPISLGFVLCEAVLANDGNKDSKETYDRYNIAMKINSAEGEVELKADEIVKIQKLLPHRWPTVISGQAHKLLEGE